jgi:hypothetical protein
MIMIIHLILNRKSSANLLMLVASTVLVLEYGRWSDRSDGRWSDPSRSGPTVWPDGPNRARTGPQPYSVSQPSLFVPDKRTLVHVLFYLFI